MDIKEHYQKKYFKNAVHDHFKSLLNLNYEYREYIPNNLPRMFCTRFLKDFLFTVDTLTSLNLSQFPAVYLIKASD